MSLFTGLKKKLARRSSNPVTDTHAVHSSKSIESQSAGLTTPHNSNSLTSASPATRRPSKYCKRNAARASHIDNSFLT